MLNNPKVRLALQSVVAGLLTFLGILQQSDVSDMSGNDWVQAVVAGLVGALVFSGVMAGTPIYKGVGVGAGKEV